MNITKQYTEKNSINIYFKFPELNENTNTIHYNLVISLKTIKTGKLIALSA